MRTILLAALAALALSGCSKKSPDTAVVKPGEKTPEEKLTEAINNAVDVPKEIYEIAPPGGKWTGAVGSLAELGERMDAKALETKNALCAGQLAFSDPTSGDLTGTPQVRIQDARTFEIEYMIPETKGDFNRIKGDGTKRAELKDQGWSQLTSFTSSPRPMSEKEVLEWPRRFPVEMFAHYTESKAVWSSLFNAWKNGVGGYEATFEEQSFDRADGKATQYRVLATTKRGRPTTIEVIVDKQHLRPVTVKVEGTLEDGRTYNIFWTGTWKTGGTYDPGTFDIPLAKAS